MSNLRQRILDELNFASIECSIVEKLLGFHDGDILKFVRADWYNLNKSFSPFALCKYLNIPIEEYHEGYFIEFKDKEKYFNYMEKYRQKSRGFYTGEI